MEFWTCVDRVYYDPYRQVCVNVFVCDSWVYVRLCLCMCVRLYMVVCVLAYVCIYTYNIYVCVRMYIFVHVCMMAI